MDRHVATLYGFVLVVGLLGSLSGVLIVVIVFGVGSSLSPEEEEAN